MALEDRLLHRLVWGRAHRAVQALRRGRSATGRQLLLEAEASIRPRRDDDLSFPLARTVLENALAYEAYKSERFDEAIAHLARAEVIDREVEARGLVAVGLHRSQLELNLARIRLRQGDLAGAGRAYGRLLGSFEPLTTALAERNHETDSSLAKEMARGLRSTVVGDLAIAVTRRPAQELFAELLVTAPWEEMDRQGRWLRQWAEGRVHLDDGREAHYLRSVATLLSEVRSDEPLIWLSCVADVLDLCRRRVGDSDAAALAREIELDASNWSELPRARVDRILAASSPTHEDTGLVPGA